MSPTPGAEPPARGRGRQRLGAGLVAAGALLVAFAAARYVEGAVRAERAREAWEAAQARQAVDAVRRGAFATVAGYGFEPGAPVARLLIPRLGLDEIVVEGVGVEELNVGPGHLPGSPLPGERGNSVISAHRDRHFLPLAKLAVGDTVVTELGARRSRWLVTGRRVVPAGKPALFATDEPTLTLTTCWPIAFFGAAPDRLIVTATPLSPASAPRA